MKIKSTSRHEKEKAPIYERIKQILELAKASVARTVNITQVVSNWLIGRGGLKSNALRSISLSEK